MLKLPLELKHNILKHLEVDDMIHLSTTCKEMRNLILKTFKCEYCDIFEYVARCFYSGCDRFYCQDCFSDHFHDHMDYDWSGRLPFHAYVSTNVENKVFCFKVDYKDLTDSEHELEEEEE